MATNKKIKKSFKPLLFFFISAILHVMVILFLLKQKHWYQFPKSMTVLITISPDKPLDQKELLAQKEEPLAQEIEKIKEEKDLPPAKLSPRQSNFGVLWANELNTPPLEMPKPQDIQQESDYANALPDKPDTQQALSPAKEPNTPEKNTPQQEIVSPSKDSLIKPIPREESILATNTDLSPAQNVPSMTTMIDELSDSQARELLKELDILEQKLKPTDEQKKTSSKQPSSQKAESTSLLDRIKTALTENIPAPTVQKPAKSVAKKFVFQPTTQPQNKKNLIAMTQGFIENIKNTGSDWLEQNGIDRALTNDELKYISYEQQISWFLQASWKRHFANATHFTGKLNVRFLLDAKGNVSNVKIIQSSGNTILDDMVIKSIQIAAPFPPLPKYFEKTQYQISRNIYVS